MKLPLLIVVLASGCTFGAESRPDDGADPLAPGDRGEAALDLSQKRVVSDAIKGRAAPRGITNPLVFAGVPNHETGLVQCWKDAQQHCQGPHSAYCGGPVLAGSGDGPCSIQQGGLGMYQFDAGTHAQTLAQYGNGVLELDGNIEGGIDVIINKVMVCPNVAGVDTPAQAIAWINEATPGTPRFEEFLTTMAWCYNGCSPTGCSLHQQRRGAYRAGIEQLLNAYGSAYWYDGGGSASGTVLVSRPGDFNGDGKHDIVTFTHGAGDDVFVSLSNGAGFLGSSKWNDFFAIDGEIPSTGDFNGDGKDDVVTFTRGQSADVFVALSTGGSFAGATKWNDFFSLGSEVPTTGDFNGDGKDDVVTFTRGEAADVFVALSTGGSFAGATKWNDFFGLGNEIPAVGDFNGDGKDDVITFTRGSSGDVFVALSTGSGFAGATKWSDFFALDGELPVVGDFNGDGKDDIATFLRGSSGDVFVALSTGAGFLGGAKWHDFFGIGAELPGAGDFDGDGKSDIVTFTRGQGADVFVARSLGGAFEGGGKWYELFAPGNETPQPASSL